MYAKLVYVKIDISWFFICESVRNYRRDLEFAHNFYVDVFEMIYTLNILDSFELFKSILDLPFITMRFLLFFSPIKMFEYLINICCKFLFITYRL